MFDGYFDGFCPQCLLKDQYVRMRVNRMDLLECPECGLQVVLDAGLRSAILRRRGEGDFRDSANVANLQVHGRLLCRESPTEPFEVDGYNSFDSEQALRDYLAGIPELGSP